MGNRWTLFAVAAVVFGGGGSAPAAQPFSSDAGRFSVELPGRPKETQQAVPTAAGEITVHIFTLEDGDTAYFVGYSDYPEGMVLGSNPDAILDGAANGMVSNTKGNLTRSDKINQAGAPGRELSWSLQVEGKATTGRARLFLVGNRLYQAFVLGSEVFTKSPKTDDFLKSFKFRAVKLPAAAAAAPAGPRTLQPFTSEEGRFRIAMPGRPKETQQTLKLPGVGEVAMHISAVEDRGEAYMVNYTDYPEDLTRKANPETILDGVVNGMVTGTKGTLVRSEKITQDKFPGREARWSLPAGPASSARARTFLVGNRLYQVMLIAGEARTQSSTADDFFKSFTFQPGPGVAPAGDPPQPRREATVDRPTTRPAPPRLLSRSSPAANKSTKPSASRPPGPGTAAGTSQWTDFSMKNEEGGWTVKLPARPERRQESGILGARVLNIFSATAGGATYSVRVQVVPPAAMAKGADSVLGASRDALAVQTQGTVADERDSTLAGLPAREYRIEAPTLRSNVIRARSVVAGKRLYTLTVTASETAVAGEPAGTFLDSFKLSR